MSTLFLITARKGSKGVPGKNLEKIGGLSLIGWKARTAYKVARDRCKDAGFLISTDCPEMAKEARRHGFEAVMRPPELAEDDTPSAHVIDDAMEWVKRTWKRTFVDVMLLEPSSPFADYNDMSTAIAMMAQYDADLVCGMRKVEPNSVFIGRMDKSASITPIVMNMQRYADARRRQDLRPEWTMNGALYLFSWTMFERTHDIYGGAKNFGVLMPFWRSIEIDQPHDLEMANYAFAAGHVRLPAGPSFWELQRDRWLSPELKPQPKVLFEDVQ